MIKIACFGMSTKTWKDLEERATCTRSDGKHKDSEFI